MLMLTPAGYLAALGELVRFDFAGANLAKAVSQIVALLSGPAGFWFTIPLHVAAYGVLLRVIVSGRFEPMRRLTPGWREPITKTPLFVATEDALTRAFAGVGAN
jgi:hypothetical protein